MIRWGLRILLLVYLALPVAAVVAGITTVREIADTLTPIYETAAQRIETSADALESELDDLRSNFQPVVNAVNTLRNGLNSITTFISNSVNAVIDVVNNTPFVNIPRFNGITIPPLINLTFLDDVGEHLGDITDEIEGTISQTAAFIGEQTQSLGLVIVLGGAWLLLTQVLIIVVLIRGLWG